ncbi:hypothetical protein [Streptacidiphilus sp. MAP5-3]|uniref:hypothetical protein n=1 Tax=unclassified Streptacidiphilus TaxID=2643834 RepID=UPI0035140869
MSDDDIITAWTERLRVQAPGLSPERARRFVHDLFYAAQRELDKEQAEADYDREE